MLDTSGTLDRTEERPITVYALLPAFIITAVFVGVITILGELYIVDGVKTIKGWLADTHGHHWVGKGIWTMIIFAAVSFMGYLSLKLRSKEAPTKLIYWAGHTAIIVSIAITLFFIYEYVHLH